MDEDLLKTNKLYDINNINENLLEESLKETENIYGNNKINKKLKKTIITIDSKKRHIKNKIITEGINKLSNNPLSIENENEIIIHHINHNFKNTDEIILKNIEGDIIDNKISDKICNIPLNLLNYDENQGGPIFSIRIIPIILNNELILDNNGNYKSNSYKIVVNKILENVIKKSDIGGSNIIVEKVIDFVQGYSNACSYKISLGKKFINIREIKLLSIEMPNSQYAIRNKKKDNLTDIINKEDFNISNDNLYWINEDEKIRIKEKFVISNKKLMKLNNNNLFNLDNQKDITRSNIKIDSLYNILEYKYNNIIINNLLNKGKDIIIFLNNLKKEIYKINIFFKENNIEEIDFSLNYLLNFNININGGLLINYEISKENDIEYNSFDYYEINYNKTHNLTFDLITKDFNINKGGKVIILMNNIDNSLNKIIIVESGSNYIENEIVKIDLEDINGIKRLLLIKLNKNIIKNNIKFYLDNPLENKIVPQLTIDNIYFKIENYNIENFKNSSEIISDIEKRKEYKDYVFNHIDVGIGRLFDENNNTSILRSDNDESKQQTNNKFLIGYKFDKPIIINRYTLKVPDLVMNFLIGTCSISRNNLKQVLGKDTLFTSELVVNDIIKINNISRRIIKIINNLELETEEWNQEYINVKIKKISHKYPKKWSFEGTNDDIINENDNDRIIFNIETNVVWEKISHKINESTRINYLDDNTDNNNIINAAYIELNYNWDTDKIEVFDLNNNKKFKNYRLVMTSNFDGELNDKINKNIYLSELRMYSYIENSTIFYTELLYNINSLSNFIDYYNRYLNEDSNNNLINLLYNSDTNLLLKKLDDNIKNFNTSNMNLRKELKKNEYININSTRLIDNNLLINSSINDILYDEIKINYKYINNIICKNLKELLAIYNNYSFNGNNEEIYNKISNIDDEYYWTINNKDINNNKKKIYIENIIQENEDILVEGLEDEYIKYITQNNINIYDIYPIHNIVIEQGNYNSSKFIKEVESKINNVQKLRYNYNRKSYEELVEYDDRLTSEVKLVYHNFKIKLNTIKQTIKIKQHKKIFQYSNVNKDISGEGGPIYCNENYPYLYIKHRNHNLKTGDIIDIDGASGVYNISSSLINLSHSIYVHETYRCYIRLMYPIIKSINEQLFDISVDNIEIFKKFYEDYILYNNNENNLIEYTNFKSTNALSEIGYYEMISNDNKPIPNYNSETDIFLENELIIKINNVNLSKKYNNTLGRISHINKRNSNGNYLVDYMLLSESNFKIGDVIKTSVSNCYGIIIFEKWNENRLPTETEIGSNKELNKIINGYDGYSIQVPKSPNKTTLTGLGGINMSISIPIKSSLLFNLSNTPYKELGFENKQLDFDYQHSNTILSSIYNIDYIYVENDFSEDNLNDKHIIIKTQTENNFNIGDKIFIKNFNLYTNLFKTTPNTILEIESYEPFINWFDNLNINYQKILKKNIDFNELQNLLQKSIIVYYNNNYTKIQEEYLGNIGMNIEQYKNINHLNYKKNPLINIFSIKKNSYVYIYYNKKKTNIITDDGEFILTGLSDGYYKVLGNITKKYNGYINNYDNINSVIIDISSSDTFPDNYNIKNIITHKFEFNDNSISETFQEPNINSENQNELYLNEYYINNSQKPYNILDGKLNRGILRSSLSQINICGNNKELEFSQYILKLKDILSNNKIQINHNSLSTIPIIYKNYYKSNKLILIGGKYLNNTDFKKYNNYSDYINKNNIQLNIIKEIIYHDNFYEIILQFNLENFNYETNNKINYINNIDNILPFYYINFVFTDTLKNQNKISIYKNNFTINDLLNKSISINDFIDINILNDNDYINNISNINQNNIKLYDLVNVKSNSSNHYNIVLDLESFLIENFTQVYKIANFYITELNSNNNTNKNIINIVIKYISNFIDINQDSFITNTNLLNNLEKYVIIISNISENNLTNYSDIITNTYNKIPYIILTDDKIKFNYNITNYDLTNYNIPYIILYSSSDINTNQFYINKSYPIKNNDIVIFKNNTSFTDESIINKKFIIKNFTNNHFQLYYNDNQNNILQIKNNISNFTIEITTEIYKSVNSSWRPSNFDYLIESIFDLVIKSLSLNNNTIWNLSQDSIIGYYLIDDINNNNFNISIQQENETYLWDNYILDYILHVWLLTLSNKNLTENQKQIKNIMNKSLIQTNFNVNYNHILYTKLTKYTIYSKIHFSNNIIFYNTGSSTIIYDLMEDLLVNYLIFTQITDNNYYYNNIGSFLLFAKKSQYDYNDDNNWDLILGKNDNISQSSDSYSFNINYDNGLSIFQFTNNNKSYRYYKFILKSIGLLQYNFNELYMYHIQFKYLLNNTITSYAIQNIYTNFNSIFKYVPFSILDTTIVNETIPLIFNSESAIINFNLQQQDIITYYQFISFQDDDTNTNSLYYIKNINLYASNNNNNFILIDQHSINTQLNNKISRTFTNTRKFKYYKFKIISNFTFNNNDYLNPLLINNIDKIYISSFVAGNINKYDYNKLYIQDNNYIVNVIDKDTYYELELKYNLINSHLKGENIIIMDNNLQNNMFNTQNLIMNGKWYTRVFYQGNKSIYDFSFNTNTIYENKYKILPINITSNNNINYKITTITINNSTFFQLNLKQQKTIYFNPGDKIIFDTSLAGSSTSLFPIKFSTTYDGTNNTQDIGYEYTIGRTDLNNQIILQTDNSTPSTLYYYCHNTPNMSSSITRFQNNTISQIYFNNGSIYPIQNIFINEHNNTLYMSYTHNDTLIKKTILIPSKINSDNNGITFYTPSQFTTILQNQIYDAYIQDDIQCDIQITFNLKNQIFQFYSPSNTIFNLYFNHNNNNINDTILRTIGFNTSQLNNYLYYTNTNFILYRNSKITIDVSNFNLQNNNIFIYQYINNNYIDCSQQDLYYKYGITKLLDNKIATFYLNSNSLINHENDYQYNLIWSLGTIDKKNINNNQFTGNIIIKYAYQKEAYPYFQEYLPNELYISDMKGIYIPNTNIYYDTDNNNIQYKQNQLKTYIYPIQEKHYHTAQYTNLEYLFNHEKVIFNISDTFEQNSSPDNFKTDNLYINHGLPILGYFKNNHYVQYNNNKWNILYLGDDTIIKQFNSKQDAFDYIETLNDEWFSCQDDEKFYVNYYSILIEGKYRGLGGTISNRWKPESNVLNDFYFGFTIKDKIIDNNNKYTKLKTIIRLRDLGVNSPQKFIGDIEYLGDNIKNYILGYGGTIFERTLNNPVDISGDKYIYFSIKGFNKIIDINNNINAFAKIILPSAPGKDMYNNFISTETMFEDKPLDELTELEINFYDMLGNLFDFNSLNHSFTLEITEEIDYIEDTNILSKTIFQM